jgi:hypothetical protein
MPAEAEADQQGFVDLFRMKFNSDPRPGDPVVFDPRNEMPAPMLEGELDQVVRELMRDLSVHPTQYVHDQSGLS